MIYFDIPYKNYVIRATAKKRGATWNEYLKLWECDIDERDIPKNLRKFTVFNEDDISSFKGNINKRVIKNDTNPYTTLSIKEVCFLRALLKHNGNAGKAAVEVNCKYRSGDQIAKRILAKPAAQQYLSIENEKLSLDARWEFEEKIRMLKKIAVTAVPEEATRIKDMAPEHAIRAIAEANKMQGHYAPDKSVNLNVSGEVEEVKQLLESKITEKDKINEY